MFHFNRRSVSTAFFWGIFIGLLPPVPVHTPLGAFAALAFRANLPLTILVVWVGNPFTYPFLIASFYYLGCFILREHPINHIATDWHGILEQFSQFWWPYLTGAVIGGLVIATISYFVVNYLWRANVKRRWAARERKHSHH